MKLFYSEAYALSAYSFDTTRKAKWIADSLRRSPVPGVEILAPAPASEEQLCQLHDPEYVRAVKTGQPRRLAESAGFTWDPGLWTMVLSSSGGAVAAALAALQDGVAGSLSSGLHHARRDAGAGFCTFNGLALAAVEVLKKGAGSVLILDLDAHCGGGTYSLVGGEPTVRQVDVAVDDFDSYEPFGADSLSVVWSARDYLQIVERDLADVGSSGERFGLCLYNAGMDPYEGSSIGGLRGIDEAMLLARERMVFDWARRMKIPVAFVLAGGYAGSDLSQDQLVALHRLTIETAASFERGTG
ncbi:MAG: hypothetical protein LC772_08270 [Chloroflexi bacterium]|nr:hypothetical protein [Chloroflexota bacterium]